MQMILAITRNPATERQHNQLLASIDNDSPAMKNSIQNALVIGRISGSLISHTNGCIDDLLFIYAYPKVK